VTADAHNFATTSALDLEYKRLVWGLLAKLLGRDEENSARIVRAPLMEVLLMYLRR
jgi:hypothetical protein